jgi:hypothetical protein
MLPAIHNSKAADHQLIVAIEKVVDQVEDKLRRSSKDVLIGHLCQRLQEGRVECEKLIDIAKAGNTLVHEGLLHYARDLHERHERAPDSIERYLLHPELHPRRGPGRDADENWGRDVGYVSLVCMVAKVTDRPIERNPSHAGQRSAAALVAKALRRKGRHISEISLGRLCRRDAELWGESLGVTMRDLYLAHFA